MTGVVDSITGTFYTAYYRYRDWKVKRSPEYKKAMAKQQAKREEERRFEEELLKRTVAEIIPVENMDALLEKAVDRRRALADSVKDRMEAEPALYEVYSAGDAPAKYLSSRYLKTVLDRHLDGLSKIKNVPFAEAREIMKQYNDELPRPANEDGERLCSHYSADWENGRIALEVGKSMGGGFRWIGSYALLSSVPLADVHYKAPEK